MKEMIKTLKLTQVIFDKAMSEHLATLSWRRNAEVALAALTSKPQEYFQNELSESLKTRGVAGPNGLAGAAINY